MNDDERFLEQFEACRLPLAQWHHRDHIKLAYLYLCQHSFEQALDLIRQGIKALNACHQVPESLTSGYHETITFAWLSLVRFVMDQYGPCDCADEFCDAHPELSQSKTLRLFYSRALIMSSQAKANICQPDLTRFPTANHDSV